MNKLAPWFLTLSLVAPLFAAEEVVLKLDTVTKPVVDVSPKLFGGFLEHMHSCIEGGLWGEVLPDRKFGDAATPDAPLGRFWRVLGDPSNVIRTNNSVIFKPSGNAVGVECTGIYGVPGKHYRGTAYVDTEKYRGLAGFALFHGSEVMQRGEGDVPRIKGRFTTAVVQAPAADAPVTMRMIVRGQGSFQINAPTLMPASSTAGINPGVLPFLKRMAPTWLRWPGGNFAQTYHWRDGVGPRNDRPPRLNLAWPKGPVESNDFGTDEFIAVCRALQAEPVICVNVGGNGATAEEAAAWVAFCKRRQHKVKYFELGNEIYGKWEHGHTDAATYADNVLKYAQAMKAVDPKIKLIAVGHDLAWNRTVLQKAGNVIDYLSQHFYTNKDQFDALMAEPARFERFLGEVRDLVKTTCPGRDIRVTVNEWNLMGKGFYHWSLAAGLFGAAMIHGFARTDGFVGYACASDLINGWEGGTIQYALGKGFMTPLGEVIAAYRSAMHGKKVAVECAHPALDVLASRNTTGSRYSLAILNRTKTELAVKPDFGKWRPSKLHEWALSGADPSEQRDFERTDALVPTARKLLKGAADYRIPVSPYSVTIVVYER